MRRILLSESGVLELLNLLFILNHWNKQMTKTIILLLIGVFFFYFLLRYWNHPVPSRQSRSEAGENPYHHGDDRAAPSGASHTAETNRKCLPSLVLFVPDCVVVVAVSTITTAAETFRPEDVSQLGSIWMVTAGIYQPLCGAYSSYLLPSSHGSVLQVKENLDWMWCICVCWCVTLKFASKEYIVLASWW